MAAPAAFVALAQKGFAEVQTGNCVNRGAGYGMPCIYRVCHEVQVMACHAFTGCVGQPSTFNNFNKSCSRYKKECDSSKRIFVI